MAEELDSVTRLLAAARAGDEAARARLFVLVYEQLKGIAHRELYRFRVGETLSTTALVNEAYLRLMRHGALPFADRIHLLSVASKAMRRLLIDRARERQALKRGGDRHHLALDDAGEVAAEQASAEMLALDDALCDLERLDPRLARLVELRFFGGLTDEEIAGVLEISDRTVRRDWIKAKGLLYRALATPGAPP
jgi:RNA polymerase sigma factor (TIGR02999 family)